MDPLWLESLSISPTNQRHLDSALDCGFAPFIQYVTNTGFSHTAKLHNDKTMEPHKVTVLLLGDEKVGKSTFLSLVA